MDTDSNIIGAFSEEHAAQIAGLSVSQLRRWDRDFFSASYGEHRPGVPYARIYSFKDLVSLRVLSDLRNRHGVSVQHLREVSRKLAHLAEDRWTAARLYVRGKRVVIDDPEIDRKREVVSGQLVLDIPLKVAISSTRRAVAELNKRSEAEIGHITRERFVVQNAPVLAGTRIPVAAIQRFAQAGYGTDAILREYPDLTPQDVQAALSSIDGAAAA